MHRLVVMTGVLVAVAAGTAHGQAVAGPHFEVAWIRPAMSPVEYRCRYRRRFSSSLG